MPSDTDENEGATVRRSVDWLVAALLFGAAAAVSAYAYVLLGQHMGKNAAFDVWFHSDIPRNVQSMSSAAPGGHYRTSLHPIASIILHPMAAFLRTLGASVTLSIGIVFVLAAGLFTATTYALGRKLGLLPYQAACVGALTISSASFLFWSGMPELFMLGGLSFLLMLLVAHVGPAAGRPLWIAANALTLAFTVTNWSAGIIATLLTWKRIAALRILGLGFLVVLALSLVQRLIYDAGLFFSPHHAIREMRWTQIGAESYGDITWQPLLNLWSFFVTTVVAPGAELVTEATDLHLSNQSLPATLWSEPFYLVGVSAWVALLAIGLSRIVMDLGHSPFARILFLAAGFQGGLHFVYGFPTFLYSMHFLPFLMAASIYAFRTRLAPVVTGLCLIVIVAGGWNNLTRFSETRELALNAICGSERGRPTICDTWPAPAR